MLLVGTLEGRPTHAASLTDLKATWIGWSSIKITEPGFDFGGETFVAGSPTDEGWLDWFLVDGQLTPSLTGHLHLNDVRELCARMRMDYYVGGRLWTTKYGGQVCADDDKHHEWDVFLNDYSSSKIDEVRVSIEKLTASKDWTIVGSQRRKLTPVIDKVKITEDGFDFGGQTFVGSGPTHSGEVVWTWSGAQVSPHLKGTLHINNAATACARMRIEYFKRTTVVSLRNSAAPSVRPTTNTTRGTSTLNRTATISWLTSRSAYRPLERMMCGEQLVLQLLHT